MARAAGAFLRLLATFFYALEFCCAAIILGSYSYFLSILSDHHLRIAQQWKAVEGISGIAVVYTIAAVVLTCFLGGVKFFAFVAIVLDVAFCAAFVALAVLTRAGASKCSGNVITPIGDGPTDRNSAGFGSNGFGVGAGENLTYVPRLGFACRLNTACFAVAIIGAFCFLFSAVLQIWVARHHQKEKKYGPSPANNYTSGSGRRKFWNRKPKDTTQDANYTNGATGTTTYPTNDPYATKDTEMNNIGTAHSGGRMELATDSSANPYRPSGETGYTGTTMGPQDHYSTGHKTDHGGYHTGPTGTSVNPYGYDNTRPGAASNF